MELSYSAPTFRLPRYVLLMKELLKHTPPHHPEHADIQEALRKLEEVLQNLNEKTRKQQRESLFKHVTNKLRGYEELFTPGRVCHLDAPCLRKSTGRTGRKKKGRLICFNDLLIVTDGEYYFRQSTTYDDILYIEDIDAPGTKNYKFAFKIVTVES